MARILYDLDGGDGPQWRRGGKELFFTAEKKRLMAVEVTSSSDLLEIGSPKTLFEIQLVPVNFRNRYVVSSDGQRFLFITRTEDTTPAPINLVVNWMADLKR